MRACAVQKSVGLEKIICNNLIGHDHFPSLLSPQFAVLLGHLIDQHCNNSASRLRLHAATVRCPFSIFLFFLICFEYLVLTIIFLVRYQNFRFSFFTLEQPYRSNYKYLCIPCSKYFFIFL